MALPWGSEGDMALLWGGGSEQDLFLVRGTDGAMTSVTKLGGADGS